jgi:NADH-quinone oxidoreductase subunit J
LTYQEVDPKQVGISLFTSYLLLVELAAMILLGAMVVAWHMGRNDRADDH